MSSPPQPAAAPITVGATKKPETIVSAACRADGDPPPSPHPYPPQSMHDGVFMCGAAVERGHTNLE